MPQKTLSMRSISATFGATLALCLTAASLVWLISVGNVLDYVVYQIPPGQGWYLLARLLGLAGGTCLTVQLLLMLLRQARPLGLQLAWSVRQHVAFGSVTFLLILAHVICFVTAASYRGKALMLDLLLPDFTHGVYNAGTGLGVVGFWLLVVAVAAGPLLRRRMSGKARRSVHRLSVITLALALVHALTVGSERSLPMALVVLVMLSGIAIMGRALGTAMMHRLSATGR